MVQVGDRYRHYKRGSEYQIITFATHSETHQQMVIYRDQENNTWARPLEMFQETVEYQGEIVPRFSKL